MIYAVIPALNECKSIAKLIATLRAAGLRVVVVDDGSNDSTGDIARACGAHVIRHEEPQGIGPSLVDGWRYAVEQPDAESIVQLDAGGSHNPALAWFMAKTADRFGYDMVIGSRFVPGAQYIGRGWRAGCSKLAARALNFATHAQVRDWTSGYRAFTVPALRKLLEHPYHQRMHAFQIEVLGHALEDGLKIKEIPITYAAGRSSLNLSAVNDAVMEWLWLLNR